MKKYITKQSSIKGAGKGLFTNTSFKKGELIGLAHVNGQPTKEVGSNHNHNEKNPTANNIKNGNKRYLIASRNLKPGEEITTNYRMQPELEQPEDFKKKKGGSMTPQKDGYRTYSPFKNLPYIDVESDTIDSDDIVYDLKLRANNGLTKFIKKNTGLHTLPGAKVIREIPVKRKGGALLTKKVTCKSCGWEWDAEDGGNDITTCHKCGGQGLLHAQDGGNTDAMNGMMKARLAYANEFGNPAAKRMINIPDNPYQFDNGDIGTHYMASYDNYAVPQIQDENGVLILGDYGPESNEAIRFDSDEDANYFAENYKDVSPGFLNEKQYGGINKLTPKEEKQFQNFYKTLPNNLQSDDDTYDIRGYWDSEQRPTEFDYTQPKDKDGFYHAYSINGNTGEYLKSPAHPTFQHAVDEDRKIGYRPITNVQGRNIAIENKSIADPEEQSFLRNTEGPINYIEADLNEDEIEEYRRGGYIVEEINNFQNGGTIYNVKGSKGYYKKVNGKWQVDWNKSGKYQPLSKGDIKARTAVLDKMAKPAYDKDYDEMVAYKNLSTKDKINKFEPKKEATKEELKKVSERLGKDYKPEDTKLQSVDMVYPEKYLIGPGGGAIGIARNAAGLGIKGLSKAMSYIPAPVSGALNAYFGAEGIKEFADPNSLTRKSMSRAYDDPTGSNIGDAAFDVGMNSLNFVGLPFNKAFKGLKKYSKPLINSIDNTIYPTRTYSARLPGGNKTSYETSDLSKKIFKKGDWSTKSLDEARQYLSGSEATGRKGLLTGDDMIFTEYKVPFWKKNVSFDPDVVNLKNSQGVDINKGEFIIPHNKFLYPRKTTYIKAVPEHLKTAKTDLSIGDIEYSPSTIPLGPSSPQFASKPYKYIEDQINAASGHNMPLTYTYNSSLGNNQNIPLYNWKQPQFPINKRFKQGGSSNNYIELDLTPEEIQKYKDGGYVVEELPEMQSGGSPSQVWYQYTGTPWSEARKKGLTDGSKEQNTELRKRILAGEFGEPKFSNKKYQNIKSNYDRNVEKMVAQSKTLDQLVKQKVGTRAGLKSRFPELFKTKSKLDDFLPKKNNSTSSKTQNKITTPVKNRWGNVTVKSNDGKPIYRKDDYIDMVQSKDSKIKAEGLAMQAEHKKQLELEKLIAKELKKEEGLQFLPDKYVIPGSFSNSYNPSNNIPISDNTNIYRQPMSVDWSLDPKYQKNTQLFLEKKRFEDLKAEIKADMDSKIKTGPVNYDGTVETVGQYNRRKKRYDDLDLLGKMIENDPADNYWFKPKNTSPFEDLPITGIGSTPKIILQTGKWLKPLWTGTKNVTQPFRKATVSALKAPLPLGKTITNATAGKLNLGNSVAAYFGADALYNQGDSNSDVVKSQSNFINNPSWNTLGDASFETGINSLGFLGLGLGKNLIKPTYNASKNLIKGYKKVPKQLPGSPNSINQSVIPTQSLISKFNNKIDNGAAILEQVFGKILKDKSNKKAVDKGNKWLNNWINNPITQKKIDFDWKPYNSRTNFLKDELDLGYEQAKTFVPASKEYPLSNQFKELIKGRDNIHIDNKGVSYIHTDNPLLKISLDPFKYKDIKKFPRTAGSWISRNPFMSQTQRASTTVHEGVHDWVTDFLLKNSGQEVDILKTLEPASYEKFVKWKNNEKLTLDDKYMGYLANPTEVHARIMQLRKQFDMTPEESVQITSEIAQKIMNTVKRLPKKEQVVDPKFFDIIGNNPEKLAFLFRRLWGVVPVVGTAGLLNPKEKKHGGTSNDYVDVDLTPKEIKDLIAQGYVIEELN